MTTGNHACLCENLEEMDCTEAECHRIFEKLHINGRSEAQRADVKCSRLPRPIGGLAGEPQEIRPRLWGESYSHSLRIGKLASHGVSDNAISLMRRG